MTPPLPSEVLYEIAAHVDHLASRQRDLWSMTMVSRSWYSAAIPSLYRRPEIAGKNFQGFVRTICPSINAHVRKTSFSSMVKELDMSNLVHDSCRSLTARILSRLKDGLEVFVAPRASFAINCLAALSKCQNLRQLDLSLVTEHIGLPQLLHSIRRLTCLEKLSMRCKDDVPHTLSDSTWPPQLKVLNISGTFIDDVLEHFLSLPKSLTSLAVYDCRTLGLHPMKELVKALGDGLESLQIGPGMLFSDHEDLAEWLQYLPKLKRLHICEPWFSIPQTMSHLPSPIFDAESPHPLEHLGVDYREVVERPDYDTEVRNEVSLWDAIAEDYLNRVRHVQYFYRHDARLSKRTRRLVDELDDLLRALAREDGPDAAITEEDAGAYVVRV